MSINSRCISCPGANELIVADDPINRRRISSVGSDSRRRHDRRCVLLDCTSVRNRTTCPTGGPARACAPIILPGTLGSYWPRRDLPMIVHLHGVHHLLGHLRCCGWRRGQRWRPAVFQARHQVHVARGLDRQVVRQVVIVADLVEQRVRRSRIRSETIMMWRWCTRELPSVKTENKMR